MVINLVSTVGVDMESHKSPFRFLGFFSEEGEGTGVSTANITTHFLMQV